MRRATTVICAVAVAIVFLSFVVWAAAQTPNRAVPAPREGPRPANGKPDFNGIWQALNTAEYDLQDHGASLSVPPGQGIVEGNEIPYTAEALKQKKQNFENRATLDLTTANCYLPGVPRAMYMPFPFEINQDGDVVAMRFEFAHAVRIIPLDGRSRDHLEGWPDFWMGDSRGHWEGNTLVVDVAKLDERTWFDRAGNHHSDALHIVERYSAIDRDHIQYDATIEDPKVFTRPWKIGMPLYRVVDKDARVLEYSCAWFLQVEKYKDVKPK